MNMNRLTPYFLKATDKELRRGIRRVNAGWRFLTGNSGVAYFLEWNTKTKTVEC